MENFEKIRPGNERFFTSEFTFWLEQVKGIIHPPARGHPRYTLLFGEFAESWNGGHLPRTCYTRAATEAVATSAPEAHTWERRRAEGRARAHMQEQSRDDRLLGEDLTEFSQSVDRARARSEAQRRRRLEKTRRVDAAVAEYRQQEAQQIAALLQGSRQQFRQGSTEVFDPLKP